MKSPFSQVALTLVDRGLSIVPIFPGGKMPGDYNLNTGEWSKMSSWNQYAIRKPNDWELQNWLQYPDAGIGVVLGKLSGIVAVDFDYDHDTIHSQIEALIPESPVKKFGQKGYTAFYKYSGENSKKWNLNKQTVIEILSDSSTNLGHQTVLPPTIHPDTKQPYCWLTSKTLSDIDVTKLPTLPANIHNLIDGIIKKYKQPIAVYDFGPNDWQYSEISESTTSECVADALKWIPADDYNTWIEVGMALKTEFGESAIDLWESWAKQSSKFNGRETIWRWKSFKRNDKKIASVFYFAQQHGFIHPARGWQDDFPPLHGLTILAGGNLQFLYNEINPEIIISNISDKVDINVNSETDPLLKHMPVESESKTDPLLKQACEDLEPETDPLLKYVCPEILRAPGPLGAIIDWMLQTAKYPYPWLVAAAAIALVGAVKGHRLRSPSNLRTNIYTIGMAQSGFGKEHARQCVTQILIKSQQGMLQGGIPKSDTGLYSCLKKGNGRQLLQIDEIGKILNSITNKHAPPHMQGLTTMMMSLFTSAGTAYLGGQYADLEGKKDRIDIDQPCLCIHGTTTPDRMFDSMSSADAADGFLGRWLIFEETKMVIKGQKTQDITQVPSEVLDPVNTWRDMPINAYPIGNIDHITTIRPRIASYSTQALKDIEAFELDMRVKAEKGYSSSNKTAPLYTRIAEMAQKLALIAATEDHIDSTVFDWAQSLAFSRAQWLIQNVNDNISDNIQEADTKFVRKLIKQAGSSGIVKSILTRKTQKLNKKQRDEILATLIESEQIEEVKQPSLTNAKISYRIKEG